MHHCHTPGGCRAALKERDEPLTKAMDQRPCYLISEIRCNRKRDERRLTITLDRLLRAERGTFEGRKDEKCMCYPIRGFFSHKLTDPVLPVLGNEANSASMVAWTFVSFGNASTESLLKFDKVNVAHSFYRAAGRQICLPGVSSRHEHMLTGVMLLVFYSQMGCCSLSSSRTVPACRGSIQSVSPRQERPRPCLTPTVR